MRARVVSWRPGAPSHPDDESFADPAAVPPSDDQNGFFKWVYDRCPAERYAVFFWGHSIGPGGLFELNNSPEFPPVPTPSGPVMPANLSSLGETLQTFFDLRRQGQSPSEDVSVLRTAALGGGATPAGSGSAAIGSTSGATAVTQPKVEVVLFQDCWMSTVETAFELKDVARYVVASQSLVPIGYQFDANGGYVDPRGPVWPYEALIATLLAQPAQFADPLFQELKTFFDAHEVNRRPTPIVTFALLDLGEDIGAGNDIETTLKPRLKTLIRELAPLTEAERKYLMKHASIVKFKNDNPNRDLQGGEWALADVMRLCGILTTPASYDAFNPPNESQIIAAADDVARAVQRPANSSSYAVVRQVFESPAGGVPLGFSGLSVLWIPGPNSQMPAGDPYIAGQIDGTFYRTLEFVTATAVTASPTTRWSDYAFEQTT
jgi:hypothetical protein